MPFTGVLDVADSLALQGWVAHETQPALIPYLDVVINRRLARRIPAGRPQPDGRRPFSFHPFESLVPTGNTVEVYFAGSDRLLVNGRRLVDLPASSSAGLDFDLPLPAGAPPPPLEHLYPSMDSFLNKLYRVLASGDVFTASFLAEDPELTTSRAFFENGRYTRIYSDADLRLFFLRAGLVLLDLAPPDSANRILAAIQKP